MNTLVMDKETREALKGILPMDAESLYEFTPSVFDVIEDEDKRPVFTLKQMSQGDIIYVRGLISEELALSEKKGNKKTKNGKTFEDFNQLYIELLDKYLVSWNNLVKMNVDEEFEFTTSAKLTEPLRSILIKELLSISGGMRY